MNRPQGNRDRCMGVGDTLASGQPMHRVFLERHCLWVGLDDPRPTSSFDRVGPETEIYVTGIHLLVPRLIKRKEGNPRILIGIDFFSFPFINEWDFPCWTNEPSAREQRQVHGCRRHVGFRPTHAPCLSRKTLSLGGS
jgi:hypothetical protein